MSETYPQITFSPEGILEISDTYSANAPEGLISDAAQFAKSKIDESLTVAADTYGAEISEPADTPDRYNVTIDLQRALAQHIGKEPDSEDELPIQAFIRTIDRLLPVYPPDTIDRVAGVQFLSANGADGAVYERFQQWLQAGGLNEETSRSALMAMSLPFSQEYQSQVKKHFRFTEDPENKRYGALADARRHDSMSAQIFVRQRKKQLYKIIERDDAYEEHSGAVVWDSVELMTLGNCACWGGSGVAREMVDVSSGAKRLYEMKPHNVLLGRESLSLLLGLGSLAYHAASGGQADIFAEAVWKEPNEYPKGDAPGSSQSR